MGILALLALYFDFEHNNHNILYLETTLDLKKVNNLEFNLLHYNCIFHKSSNCLTYIGIFI